ncbi:MAG: hypothetical protein IPQ13_13790 [Holophagaceae bacterium]|nr:hypothetical protein [Holophagaceae bacterium]
MRHSDDNPITLSSTFVVGVVGSFGAALLFIWLLWLTLQPSDWAFGTRFTQVIFNPMVLMILLPTALIAGLLVSPIIHYSIAGRHHRRCMAIVFGGVYGWIALITPFSPKVALLGIALVLALALLICRYSSFTQLAGKTPSV